MTYDFSGFARNPPSGMKVQCANCECLWLSRLAHVHGMTTREDYFVAKTGDTFTLYRLGHWDQKRLPSEAMRDENAILQASLPRILRALGYGQRSR